VHSSLHRVDARHVARQLRAAVEQWSPAPNFTVVNFTHDGWFLRETFLGHRIVTVINDDFEAPFVVRLDGSGGAAGAVSAAIERFDALQGPIADYCAANAPESRLQRLVST
jgi:hypothetical protein